MSRSTAIVLASFLLAVYPLLVWAGLARFGAPALFGLLLLMLGLRLFVVGRGRWRLHAVVLGLLFFIAGVGAVVTGSGNSEMLRWYPVLASLVASGIFAVSLVGEMPVIERIARLRTPQLPPHAIIYTRRLTLMWALLTFANALVAAWTAMYASLETWALYNGLLSYLVLGTFFGAEWLYRQYRFSAGST